ncbi:purple acid phosphatase, partial [Perkinsus chesapeaki]
MFVDLHYGENFVTGNLSQAFQRKLLEMEKPDLVVFNGDMSSDYSASSCQASGNCTDWFIDVWKQYTKPVSDAKVPYAITIGNHDAIGNLPDSRFIVKYDQDHGKTSFTRVAPPGIDGGSVYYLPIYASSTASRDRPTAVLWMIDTGDRNCYGVPGYDCAGYDQVQ